MATSISTLKSWFTTGKFPTQAQFWAWLDSFRHKDESIPVNEIEGLNELLDLKADLEALNNNNTMLSLKENTSNKSTSIITDAASDSMFPSVKAVKTYVESKIPLKISNTTTYTSAPTTANQVLSILEIPANTFANGDIINFKALFTKLTGLSSCDITIWKNTTPSLTGTSVFYKAYDIIYPYVKIVTYDHKIGIIKNNTLIVSTQKGGGDSYNFIDTDYNLVDFEINFNPAVSNYLIVTCELTNLNDVIKQEAILIEKIN